jgi:hypothetical protein
MGKVIRDSHRNVKHEYDANHAKQALDRYCQKLPKEERSLLYGLGKRSPDWCHPVLRQPIPGDKKVKCGRTRSIAITAATLSVTIQHIRAILEEPGHA